MRAIIVERRVEAPPERVFEVFTDLGRAAEVMRGVDRIEVLTPGPVGRGTRWRETRTMFGREAVEEMWIGEFEPPHRYVVDAESHGARYRTEFTFQPAPDGLVTVVRMSFGAEPQTFVARVLGALMAGVMSGSIRKALGQDMDDLKAACERRPEPAAALAPAAGALAVG
jgi:uncharacterized protein YndB with AHSA1/START domain